MVNIRLGGNISAWTHVHYIIFFILNYIESLCSNEYTFNFIKWFLCVGYWKDVRWHWLNNNTYLTMHGSIGAVCFSNDCYDFYYYCVYDNDTDSSHMHMYPIRKYQYDFGYCYYSLTLIPLIHGHIDDLAYDLNYYYIDSYYLIDRGQSLSLWQNNSSIDLCAIAHWIADDYYYWYCYD